MHWRFIHQQPNSINEFPPCKLLPITMLMLFFPERIAEVAHLAPERLEVAFLSINCGPNNMPIGYCKRVSSLDSTSSFSLVGVSGVLSASPGRDALPHDVKTHSISAEKFGPHLIICALRGQRAVSYRPWYSHAQDVDGTRTPCTTHPVVNV